mmetsp:Transcript_22658/g.51832  ORF Transcript_22658/g.51832 Transcript_22658/m.51832 type:complete len:387 (-) Transcript_22658:233-1393(-)
MPWRMTTSESNPSATVSASLRCAAASRVGSQRDSLVSVRRKITSCASTIRSSSLASSPTCDASAALTGWPGIGMPMRRAPACTHGKMRRSAAAAASALGVSPPMQSSKVKSDCRTGLEYATTPLSTKVMVRTPQPRRQRATAQPSVPAPTRRQLVAATASLSSCGISRQRISRRLRSTDASARASGSICADRSICRGPALFDELRLQPTALGGGASRGEASKGPCTSITTERLSPAAARGGGGKPKPSACKAGAAAPGCGSRYARMRTDGHSRGTSCCAVSSASKLRRGQPGLESRGHGSQKASHASAGVLAAAQSANAESGPTSSVPLASTRTAKKAGARPRVAEREAKPSRSASRCVSERREARATGGLARCAAGTTSAGNANQ